MSRILMIGSSGAGKSTFAKKLAAQTGLPLIHLDDLYWDKGWVKVKRELWEARLQEALEGENWIMDGNYGRTLGQRAAQADTVIFFVPPRELCLWRVIWRELSGKHPHISGLKPNLPEWEFLPYTWAFPNKVVGMLEVLAQHKPLRVGLVRSDREAQMLLNTAQSWIHPR